MTDGRTSRRRFLTGAATAGFGVLAGQELASRLAVAAPPDALDRLGTAADRAFRVDPPDPPPPPPPGGYNPTVRYVGIYGFPGSSQLGILGQLSVEGGSERARSLAAQYAGFERPPVPFLEIIASVAAANAGADGDYSNEFATSFFEPHLAATRGTDVQVVFDLQPGRSTFLQQAREYEPLWYEPHVHMALDPEWRTDPPRTPGGGTIGTVDASEVNATIDYLDGIIRARGLPRKMVVVHQFTPSMITNKPFIRGTENVHVVIQMDGFGSLTLKRGSYSRVVDGLPAGATTGWKNFFTQERTPTPAETVDNDPPPMFVSYQ